MRQSILYTKTTKNDPSGEVATNAKLLIRGGFIHKEMAGVYSYLPLGLRVLEKIRNIIREEMNIIGGQELYMSTLQDPSIWQESDRWVDEDDDPTTGLPWFKTKLTGGGELGIATTHEEDITNIMKNHISSYKDLPIYTYQIQNKFRNELRAKNGLLRGREFLMKDMYSFTRTQEALNEFYEICAGAYMNIFEQVGLGDITYRTFASGGAFSKYSDEFQTVSEAGEDTIYLDEKKGVAVNKEVYNDIVLKDLGLNKKDLVEKKAIEVGNIFSLGTRFSEALNLKYKDEDGKEQPIFMGSYGIGLGRLMATVVEVLSDDKGIVWPESIAPYKAHLIEIGEGLGEKLYKSLIKAGVDVLYDDRDTSAGDKLNDADLMGIPWRLVVSEKTKGKVEIKERASDKEKIVTENEVIRKLT